MHQGIFVYDMSKGLSLIASTDDDGFENFVFWNYSGAPPGQGNDDGDREPPRFRSNSFVTVSGDKGNGLVAFKARTELETGDIIDGIYAKSQRQDWSGPLTTVEETGMDGTELDPDAVVPETGEPLFVDEVAIERESLADRRIVVTVGFSPAVPLDIVEHNSNPSNLDPRSCTPNVSLSHAS